jgi:predicted SAM-dependent methyltransferase
MAGESKRVLDVGCGRNKYPGAVGIDINVDATAVDVICNVNRPLPFRDDTFDHIYASHIVEHVEDVIAFMTELHRVARPGGTVFIATPHHTDFSSWRDPTHRWHLNTYSFVYFDRFHGERFWYTRTELRHQSIHVEMARPWKWLGLQWLVNHSEGVRRLWEMYFCYLLRGKQMDFMFEVVK